MSSNNCLTSAEVVRQFIERVRSGREPRASAELMAPNILSHQIVSGKAKVIERTPANYQEHIEEFLAAYGQYDLTIEEFLSDGDKVYVRWRQTGRHLGEILGYAPTGLPLVWVGSAVYKVLDGKIVEYWIQQENKGLLEQLRNQLYANQ
ncbi:MAG TPA: ester cyclase [Burkholderiaceae bacterium]|jgi:predicted ester cyclase